MRGEFVWNEQQQIFEIEKDPDEDAPFSIHWYDALRGADRYWTPRSYFVPGDTVTPPREAINGHRYRCTIGGRTGGSAPVWPTTGTNTVTDGGVTWTRIGLEDRIATSTWTVETGIDDGTDSIDATECVTTLRLSGGTLGRGYIVTNAIVTDAGYDFNQRFRVLIRQN